MVIHKGLRKINFNESEMPNFMEYLKDMDYTIIHNNDKRKFVLDKYCNMVFIGSKCWYNDNPEIWECKIDIDICPQLIYKTSICD